MPVHMQSADEDSESDEEIDFDELRRINEEVASITGRDHTSADKGSGSEDEGDSLPEDRSSDSDDKSYGSDDDDLMEALEELEEEDAQAPAPASMPVATNASMQGAAEGFAIAPKARAPAALQAPPARDVSQLRSSDDWQGAEPAERPARGLAGPGAAGWVGDADFGSESSEDDDSSDDSDWEEDGEWNVETVDDDFEFSKINHKTPKGRAGECRAVPDHCTCSKCMLPPPRQLIDLDSWKVRAR